MSKSKTFFLIVFLKSKTQSYKTFQNPNAFTEYLSNMNVYEILMNVIQRKTGR